jgi:hypothetical protein
MTRAFDLIMRGSFFVTVVIVAPFGESSEQAALAPG